MGQNMLKIGPFYLFGHSKWSKIYCGKQHLYPTLTPFSPKISLLRGILWLLRGQNGLQWAQNDVILLVWATHNAPESFLQKHMVDPILTHLSFRKTRISKAF